MQWRHEKETLKGGNKRIHQKENLKGDIKRKTFKGY